MCFVVGCTRPRGRKEIDMQDKVKRLLDDYDSEAGAEVRILISRAENALNMYDGVTCFPRGDIEYGLWTSETVDDIVDWCLNELNETICDYESNDINLDGPINTEYKYETWSQMKKILNRIKVECGSPS